MSNTHVVTKQKAEADRKAKSREEQLQDRFAEILEPATEASNAMLKAAQDWIDAYQRWMGCWNHSQAVNRDRFGVKYAGGNLPHGPNQGYQDLRRRLERITLGDGVALPIPSDVLQNLKRD